MIRFENVRKIYEGTEAVDNISFTIEKGEFVTILGSSGSGKTTTLKMMNRLIEPTTGDIYFQGKSILEQDLIALRRHMGYVVQQIGLFPHMTVEQNIGTVPGLLGWDKDRIKKRTKEMLDLVKLPFGEFAGRYPRELSGGQQQRIGVARAMAADPEVMLFDEPLGAVDAITRLDLQNELIRIHQSLESKTFIFITHDIYEAFRLGTRVMIMNRGRIARFDTPGAILEEPGDEYVKKLLDTVKKQDKIWESL